MHPLQGCNTWTYCIDPLACNGGELFRWRQCWLKAADPFRPRASDTRAPARVQELRGDQHSIPAPGWVSGVRRAQYSS